MHLCIFYHRSMCRSDGLHHLILHFPARPFSALVGKADSPPIKFTPAFWGGWHLTISYFFYFLQGASSNTLAFRKNIEDSAPFLGVPLWLFVSNIFGTRLRSCRKIWSQFPVFSNLVSGLLRYPNRSSGNVLAGFSTLGSLCDRGSKVFWGTASLLWAMSWEAFSLRSVFGVLWRRRDRRDIFHSLRQDLLCSCLYSYSVEEERIR